MNSEPQVSVKIVNALGRILKDESRPLKERFRALFSLRNIGGDESIDWIIQCLHSKASVLLRHECAYCLGQMRANSAVHALMCMLEIETGDTIVRHEAAEALAALDPEDFILDSLLCYVNDFAIEVAETCQIAVAKLSMHPNDLVGTETQNPYNSVDPAPPLSGYSSVEELEKMFLDEQLPLFDRYRAMFTLRNIGTEEAVLVLAKGLRCRGALFKHEVAFVLGQIQSDACVEQLKLVLADLYEHEMVRHECAEALGAIATPECEAILRRYLQDRKEIVRQSCEVALDMCDYENSAEFQFSDMLLDDKKNTENTSFFGWLKSLLFGQ